MHSCQKCYKQGPLLSTRINFNPIMSKFSYYYSDAIMSAMAQITGVSIVCSTVCSGRSKKTSTFRVTGLYEGNPPVTGGFPSKRDSNAEDVSFDDVIMCPVNDIICNVFSHVTLVVEKPEAGAFQGGHGWPPYYGILYSRTIAFIVTHGNISTRDFATITI